LNSNNSFELKKIVKLYNTIGLESRNMDFFSKSVYDVYKNLFFLPCIDKEFKEILAIDKTKLSIFAILLDDLADNPIIRDKSLLDKAINIPFNRKKKYFNNYLNITNKIWSDIINSIKKYPRYSDFIDIFYFDLDQFFSSVKYGFILNTTKINNKFENDRYSYHNMMIMIFLDMDIMCSPLFNENELNLFRPIAHKIQDICHVGNVLSTYKREIKEKDFSSPMIAKGLLSGLIKRDEVITKPEHVAEKLHPLYSSFKKRARRDFKFIKNSTNEIKSIDINEFFPRLEKVWDYFINRPQYWKLNKIKLKENIPIKNNVDLKNFSVKWVRM